MLSVFNSFMYLQGAVSAQRESVPIAYAQEPVERRYTCQEEDALTEVANLIPKDLDLLDEIATTSTGIITIYRADGTVEERTFAARVTSSASNSVRR